MTHDDCDKNFTEYIKKFSRHNLSPTKKVESIDQLVAEGMKLLEEETKSMTTNAPVISPVVPNVPAKSPSVQSNSKNPYIRARISILSEMTDPQRMVIEKMEAGTLPMDSRYDKFAYDIRILGDKFSA